MLSRLPSGIILGVLAGCVFFPAVLSAQSFSLTPGKLEAEVAPGAQLEREIAITNTLGRDTTFKIEFEDVEPGGVGEGVKLLGNKTSKNSLKNYFLTPEQFVSVRQGATVRVPISIILPQAVFPGSLHGAVFVSPVVDDISGGPQAVPRLGILTLVRVIGDRIEVGKLQEVSVWPPLAIGYSNPQLRLRFENTGNTYLNPYGLVTVTNFISQTKITLPIKPWFVLPQSTREHQIKLPVLSSGIYQIRLDLNRGYNNQIDVVQKYMIVMPWWVVGFIVLLSFGGLWWMGWRVFKTRMVY